MKNILKNILHFLLRVVASIAAGGFTFVIIYIIGAYAQVTSFGLLAALLFLLALGGVPLIVMYFTFVLFPPFTTKHIPCHSQHPGNRGYSSDDKLSFTHGDCSSNDVIIASMSDWQHFLDTHVAIREICTKVAGTSYNNDDGSSRQEILSYCSDGDMIDLEYFDYQGEPAFAVYTRYGQIGNLPADIAQLIGCVYDNYVTGGVISKVTGGKNGYHFGCNLLLTVYKEK